MESRMIVLVFVGVAQFFVFSNGHEMCWNRDISNERRFQIQKIDGLWYQHFYEDNTFFKSILPTDGKFYYLTFGINALKYFYGRNQSRPGCEDTIFLDVQKTPGSPCMLVQYISPELGRDTWEIMYSLFPGNDQLLITFCQNPPSCTKRLAIALTRRRRLCQGERELFLRKFKDLGISVLLNNQLQPTTNDCTMPGLENVKDKRSRSCRQVTRDALGELEELKQDRRYRKFRY